MNFRCLALFEFLCLLGCISVSSFSLCPVSYQRYQGGVHTLLPMIPHRRFKAINNAVSTMALNSGTENPDSPASVRSRRAAILQALCAVCASTWNPVLAFAAARDLKDDKFVGPGKDRNKIQV